MVESGRTAYFVSNSTSFLGNAALVKGHGIEIFVQVKSMGVKHFGLKRLLDYFFSTSFLLSLKHGVLVDVVFNLFLKITGFLLRFCISNNSTVSSTPKYHFFL